MFNVYLISTEFNRPLKALLTGLTQVRGTRCLVRLLTGTLRLCRCSGVIDDPNGISYDHRQYQIRVHVHGTQKISQKRGYRRRTVDRTAVFPKLRAPADDGFPLVDLHVHLTPTFTIDQAMEISKKTGVQFGIMVNPGGAVTDDAGPNGSSILSSHIRSTTVCSR